VVRASTRVIGNDAENLALQFLQQKGLMLVQRNFQCRLGELDLIMRDHDCLVIVEVRYRSGRSLVSAGCSVDHRKQQKLIRSTALFLAWSRRFANWPLRFDVIGIDADTHNAVSIEWIRDAFRPADAAL